MNRPVPLQYKQNPPFPTRLCIFYVYFCMLVSSRSSHIRNDTTPHSYAFETSDTGKISCIDIPNNFDWLRQWNIYKFERISVWTQNGWRTFRNLHRVLGLIRILCCVSFPELSTRVGTLIVVTIYLQLIQNRYMFRSLLSFSVVTSIVYNPLPAMWKS